jgi:hypothetical protein
MTPDTPPARPSGRRPAARCDETVIDSGDWLHDIRREFPLIGVLHAAGLWTAVWGSAWRVDARTAFELYDLLRQKQRAGELPYQQRKDPA